MSKESRTFIRENYKYKDFRHYSPTKRETERFLDDFLKSQVNTVTCDDIEDYIRKSTQKLNIDDSDIVRRFQRLAIKWYKSKITKLQ